MHIKSPLLRYSVLPKSAAVLPGKAFELGMLIVERTRNVHRMLGFSRTWGIETIWDYLHMNWSHCVSTIWAEMGPSSAGLIPFLSQVEDILNVFSRELTICLFFFFHLSFLWLHWIILQSCIKLKLSLKYSLLITVFNCCGYCFLRD